MGWPVGKFWLGIIRMHGRTGSSVRAWGYVMTDFCQTFPLSHIDIESKLVLLYFSKWIELKLQKHIFFTELSIRGNN